jgi:trigger factor
LLKSVEDITTTKKRISIEIPSDVIEREIAGSFEKLKQKVRIPGFRSGKAPVSLIEKRFGKEVEAEVIEKLVPEYYNMALREASLNPVAMPVLDEKFEFKRHNPLNLSFVIEIVAKIENLNYENITIKDIPFSVEDSDIDITIKKLQNQKAVLETADKEVEMDDLVAFEHVDSEIEGEASNPAVKEAISKMGREIFPQDIMEKVLGKKKDDIIEFTRTFDESLSKELAGKTVNIKVKISEVKRKIPPALDDEFAKDLGFENFADMQEKLRERIHTAKKDQVQKIQKVEIIRKLIETNSVEVPETLINNELDTIIMEKGLDSKEEIVHTDPMTEIMEDATETGSSGEKKEDTDDPQAKLREKAVKNVQASVIIDAIGKKEGILVTDSEVDERLSSVAKKLSTTPDIIRDFYKHKEGSLDSLRHSLYEEKVMDLLLSKAVIEKGE